MRSLFLFILALVLTSNSFGQTPGAVTVIRDPKIDSLIAKRIELNRESAHGALITTQGFRVQIFSGADRSEAYEAQSRFKARYPLMGSYISYIQPNYKIRVGDFRTRMEAEKFMNELRPHYPSLFIISEQINLRR
ncbi:MAG TPA: SPOR domain-containing protein [Sphingobacteriaceae bacterium]